MTEFDRKAACEKLNLPENATMDEVEKRYQILSRRSRSRQLRGEWSQHDIMEWGDIQQAYACLRQEDEQLQVRQYRQQLYGKYKRWAGAAEKADHFWSYHRYKVISLIVMLATASLYYFVIADWSQDLKVMAEQPPADLKVMVIGDFALDDRSGMEAEAGFRLARPIPDWNYIETSMYDVPKLSSGRMDDAKIQMAAVALHTERPDVYIMDRSQYMQLLQLGYLQKTAESAEYGNDISRSPLVQILTLPGGPVYAAISAFTDQPENAQRFIEHYTATE